METKEMIAKVCENWAMYKAKETKTDDYGTTLVKTLNGYTTAWENPNLLWLLVEIEDGSYDGSGCQVGLSKEGKLVWEYQSHCSCNGFEDTDGTNGHGELCLGCAKDKKSYALNMLPDEWEKIIKVNLEEILK